MVVAAAGAGLAHGDFDIGLGPLRARHAAAEQGRKRVGIDIAAAEDDADAATADAFRLRHRPWATGPETADDRRTVARLLRNPAP